MLACRGQAGVVFYLGMAVFCLFPRMSSSCAVFDSKIKGSPINLSRAHEWVPRQKDSNDGRRFVSRRVREEASNYQRQNTQEAGDPKIRTAIPRFIISLSFVIVSLLLCWFGLNDERPRVRAALFVSAFASLGFGLFVWWSLLL